MKKNFFFAFFTLQLFVSHDMNVNEKEWEDEKF